jgi:adhesin transport system outer membrane protein
MKIAIGAAAALILLSPQVGTAQTARRFGLDQLVAMAIQSHPGVAARRAELGAARSEVEAARWQYFPTPSVQARDYNNNGGTATVLALQQPLWAGGRLDAGLDAADARARSADISITEAQYNLALRVTSAWQSWMQARGRINALTKSVGLLDSYSNSVRRRIAGGVSAEVDHELVVARLTQSQGDLSAVRASERSALAQLSQMVGLPLRTENVEASGGTADDLPALEVLVEQAAASSPTLRRLDADIEAARHDTAQKDAALWPTLNLRAERQRADPTGTGSGTYVTDNRVMLVLDYVPGAGLSAAASADAARTRIGGLMASRDAGRRDLIEKVSADYEEHLSSRDRKRNLQNTLKANTEVLASYDRLFVAGKRSWLDVLNAARELTEVELSLADVEAQLVASRYRLRLHGGELPQGKDS